VTRDFARGLNHIGRLTWGAPSWGGLKVQVNANAERSWGSRYLNLRYRKSGELGQKRWTSRKRETGEIALASQVILAPHVIEGEDSTLGKDAREGAVSL